MFEIVVWPMIDIIAQGTVLGYMVIRRHMYIDMYVEHDGHEFHGFSFLTWIGSSRQQRIGRTSKKGLLTDCDVVLLCCFLSALRSRHD